MNTKVQLAMPSAQQGPFVRTGAKRGFVFTPPPAEPTTSDCTVYEWCVEVDSHLDHMGEGHDVPSHEDEEPLLIAGLLHVAGSRLFVNIGGDDFTATQARTKAQQLRELADAIDAMADTVDAARATTG